jgi:Cu(I)/Ag(I) efflux system protein CusF
MNTMFSILAAGAVALAATTAAYGQGAHDHHGAPGTAKEAAAKHKASGVVKRIDREAGRVTLAHGPVQSLNWPGMVMAFAVQDKKLLDGLAVDRKVEFEFIQQDNKYIVTAIKAS